MGSISTGIGLISGIDTASLIDSLITLESRGKVSLQTRLASLQTQQTALLDINSKLLALKSSAQAFRKDSIFRSNLATSSNEEILTAVASTRAQPGTFQFIVKQLVATSQQLSRGFATRDLSPVGLSSLSFEFGRGGLAVDTNLENLNGGAGIDRGVLLITDRAGNNAEIDLTDVTTLNEVLQRINSNGIAAVTATVDGDHLVITDFSGQNGTLSVTSALGDTTAADLGIEGAAVGDTLTGGDINSLGGTTTLASLNDGNGVLVRDNVADFEIETRDGAIFQIDLGRIDAPMTTETLLSELNNGAGVTISSDGDNQDIAFVDRNGTQHDVDLTGVTTVGSLISRVSSQTGGAIALSIAADGDRFTVTDLTGGTGPLKVLGAGTNGTDTAEDLGILQEDGVNDVSFDGQLVPNTISQAPATTLQQVIDRINSALDETEAENGGRVVAAIGGDGVSLEITDNTVGGGSTTVRSIPGINDFAASQLGIEQTSDTGTITGQRLIATLGSVLVRNLNGGAGLELPEPGSPATLTGQTLLEELFNGSGITSNGDPGSVDMRVRDRTGTNHDVELDGLTTVQDLIDAVNTATGGAVTMSIEGQALRVDDQTGSTSDNLRITNRNGASVATELGIEINAPVDFVVGVDTEPVHSGTATIQITNRAGVSSVIDITGEQSIQNILSRINAEATDVTASLNQAGNGLLITDTSGGTQNLRILGDAAASLGIQGDVDSDTVEGQNLQLRYVAASSRLADLNYGRGIGTGTFRITDGLGQSAEVNIGTDSTSLYDIIAEINSRGLAINARVNDNGDGLLIEESLDEGETAFTQIKIETVSGTTARDLNILGESSTVAGGFIDGSYERVVDVTASDTLDELVAKINDAGAPVSATIINTGSGPQPFRLNLTSQITGTAGELIVDARGGDLGLSALAQGQDAKVFFGASNPEDGFLLSSSANSLTDVLQGVSIDLHQASDEPVTVNVARDQSTIVASITSFIETFNSIVSTIDQYDSYDAETEQRGVLLGNPVVARVRQELYRAVQQRGENVSGSFQFLSQVGITIAAEGQLAFDETKFSEAYAEDPDAVEALFATFEASAGTTREIAPGITVPEDSQSVLARGFGDLLGDLANALTDSVNGTLSLAKKGYDDRIKLINDRIEQFDQKLAARRARLEAQFAAMESALATLQGQGSALQSLSANLALSVRQLA